MWGNNYPSLLISHQGYTFALAVMHTLILLIVVIFSIFPSSIFVNESDGNATLTIFKEGFIDRDVDLVFATSDGTATEGKFFITCFCKQLYFYFLQLIMAEYFKI